MIPEYRRDFNARFTPEKYERFLREIDQKSGAHVKFRCSETPCFFPPELLCKMVTAGEELVQQLVSNPEYLAAADRVIPPGFDVPNCPDRPLFVQADFGIIRGASGEWEPRLVEIQGFPSLYGFQLVLANAYRDIYELDPSLKTILGGLDEPGYVAAFREAVLGGHDPTEVVLLEIDPWEQKTVGDFVVTERLCGIRTVDIRAVRKEGRKLFHDVDGKSIRIERVYNRTIVDELVRREIQLPFDFRDDLDVEWAGHPNWFFRISKFSLPFLSNELNHETVPKTWFLDQVRELPLPPEDLVLKPLFSFAGTGVTVGPTKEDIDRIATAHRGDYILQERVNFEATIDTPPGWAKAEVRVMYIDGPGGMRPVNTIIRTGRGKMMGVDHNKDLDWVGASAGFYPPES
jgi:hypothetical protein